MYSKEELKELKRTFWTGFDDYCSLLPEFRGKRCRWILYDTKVKGVELKFDATREGAFVILEINHRNEAERLEMYERVEWYKEQLEQGFSGALVWDPFFVRESGQQVARVYCFRGGLDIHRREHWPGFYEYLAANMLKLQENFLRIREYIRFE
ncbi:MAG: DUF4268 domain-containing protein [Bacteroidales bacterium]|nr:DUF4268 domain-containing protein [Bacteroidales bacterium]